MIKMRRTRRGRASAEQRQQQLTIKQLVLNRFVASVNEKLETGKAPAEVLASPLLIGQCAHEVMTDCCAVYLMPCRESASEVTYVKIGLARNIRKRMKEIMIGCPLEVKKAIYFCLPGFQRAYKLEQDLHQAFVRYHARGEWLRFENQLQLAEVVPQIIEHTEDQLQGDFNQFTFDTTHTKHPDLPKIRLFAKLIWSLADDAFDFGADFEEAVTPLSGSSQEHHERVIRHLTYRR